MRNVESAVFGVTYTPALDTWPDKGVYQVWFRVAKAIVVTVGRLGRHGFPAGWYVYTGRASRALRARVARHARGAERLHWHIDYLLARAETEVLRIALVSRDPMDECRVNQATCAQGAIRVRRFGASDCAAGCDAHLGYLGQTGPPI